MTQEKINYDRHPFFIYFGTESHQMDATVLGNCLVEHSNIISELRIFNQIPCNIGLRVNTFEKGGFWTSAEIVAYGATLLSSTPECLKYVEMVMTTLVGYLKIMKALKGEEPKSVTPEGNNVRIEANDNSQVYVDNRSYYFFKENEIGNAAAERIFANVQSDNDILEYKITDSKRKALFVAKRNDFSSMIRSQISQPEKEKREIVKAKLIIKKPDLDDKPLS